MLWIYDYELSTTNTDDLPDWYFEPCGINGNYIRVSIRTVKDGIISEDKLYIDSILSVGKYAISHSPEYRDAYHPHYRIISRDIFEREIEPLIIRH